MGTIPNTIHTHWKAGEYPSDILVEWERVSLILHNRGSNQFSNLADYSSATT